MKERFVFFEESWNEESTSNRGVEVLDGRTSPTRVKVKEVEEYVDELILKPKV